MWDLESAGTRSTALPQIKGKAAGHGAQLHYSPSLPCLTGCMSLLALLTPDMCTHALTHFHRGFVCLSQAVKDK